MTVNVTTTSNIETNLKGHYDRNLLERAVPALIHGRYAQVRPMPKKKGNRINFRRYNSLAVNTTPLTEGVTPAGQKLSSTNIYATVRQYGDFVTYSDWLDMTGLDATIVEATDLLGENMGEVIDTLDRNVFIAGTSVRYAGGVSARTSIVTGPAVTDLKSAVRTLRGGNAKMISEMTVAGAKIATRPIARGYRAIQHTDCQHDFEALAGFTKSEEYASQKGVTEEEYGSWGNVRFEMTTLGKIYADGGGSVGSTGLISTSASATDVYITMIFGKNACGTVPLQKSSVKSIIKQMGSAGTEDALDQRASVGWKAARTAKILNDDFMIRYEHALTDF